jgi:hypothetical protein
MAPPPAAGTSRPAKAAHRYRPGQAPAGYTAPGEEEDESSEEEDEEQTGQQKRKPVAPIQVSRTDGLQVVNQGQGTAIRQLKVQGTIDPAAAAAAQRAKDGKHRK